MNPTTSGQCPFHAKDASPTPAAHPRGIWPPGPSTSLTGWSLLARMSRDLLGTLAAWQREFGDRKSVV